MDDLDKELFNTTLRRGRTYSSSQLAQKSDYEDFDENDPLGELLSSSGEHTPRKITPKQSSSKDSSNTSKKLSKSKLIADLFGLDKQEEEIKNVTSSSPKSTNMKQSLKVEDPSDWLGLKAEPDFDPINSSSKPEKHAPSAFLSLNSSSRTHTKEEHILTPLYTKDNPVKDSTSMKPIQSSNFDEFSTKTYTSDRSLKDTKKPSSVLSSFISDFDDKPAPASQQFGLKGGEPYESKSSYTPSANREPRRSTRRRGVSLADPLGLFNTPPRSIQEHPDHATIKETQENKKEAKASVPGELAVLPPSTSDQIPQWLGGVPAVSEDLSSLPPTQTLGEKSQEQNDTNILGVLANLDAQTAEAATQQQKSFISALALKRQEETLLKLQSQQAALLTQHEQQLEALVQRQIQRQQQMIKQQGQIQAYIQALMVQPPSIPQLTLPSGLWNSEESSKLITDSEDLMESSRAQRESNPQIKTDLKNHIHQLEVENENLKVQLESERQRHEGHMTDIENMFRRQLTVQEEAMVKQEKRFKAELDSMEEEVASRVSRIKGEHKESSHQQTQRMAQLHSEWLADLQRLSEFHQQAVEMLRSEQTSAIEHWKNLQAAEIKAVKEANSNARLLEGAVSFLKESNESLIQLKKHVQNESETQFSRIQESLLKQEMKLNGLLGTLEKQAASLETERVHLSTLNQDLQSRLLKQQQDANDEKVRFEAREREWEREKMSAVEMLDKGKRHIEKLQIEARSELADLNERKLALAADVARLETTLQIQSSNAYRNSQHAEQMVAEARATLEAAQEAGKEVQRERDETVTLKLSLATEQKRLQTLERDIRAREQKLEEETLRARAFRDEGRSALEEARRLERERSEHASDLAQRLFYLKEREDRLAEEKLAVTIQWKRIQESRESTTCLNCGPLASVNLSSFNSSKDIIDPLPIIMKLEAEQVMDFRPLDRPKYNSSLLESVSQ